MENLFLGKHGPLLIAEIGGNHEGDFDYAKKLTQLAIESDVDYIKFQIYTGDTLVSSIESPDRNKHFKKFELTSEQHRFLAQMVIDSGIGYTASVWDVPAMFWIDDFISLYKIGSGDLTAYPVIKATVQHGKPIVLSTGLSTEEEVLSAIAYIQEINPEYKRREMLAILQCTSMYPIPFSAANLKVMDRFKHLTGLTVGYSDHTEGSTALKYAIAMGAEILEFHFTDSREGKVFRDHKVSLTKDEILELIKEISIIKTLHGSENKQPVDVEIENGHLTSFRRAVYPKQDIAVGEILTENNLTTLRPNVGIDARYFDDVLGKKALVSLVKHQKLSWDLLT